MEKITNGIPRYMRLYSNEGTQNETLDCITAIFTRKRISGEFMYIGSSKTGRGYYQHGSFPYLIDRPTYKHLGKKIKFNDLTPELQTKLRNEYCELWNIKNK